MMNGVELGHPGHHDGGKAAAVHDGGGQGVVGAGGQEQIPSGRTVAPESTMVRMITRSTLIPA